MKCPGGCPRESLCPLWRMLRTRDRGCRTWHLSAENAEPAGEAEVGTRSAKDWSEPTRNASHNARFGEQEPTRADFQHLSTFAHAFVLAQFAHAAWLRHASAALRERVQH